MISSVRIDNDEYDKDHAADFVLWKAYDPIKDGPNKWTGIFMIDEKEVTLEGRPGWHIECSACNLKYFGAQIDIHMGGVDNIFPHHQNEIAQSEAYTGKQFSRYWIHGGHLQVEGKKMAKSAGNFYTLRDLYAKFPDTPKLQIARAFRLMAFGVNYRENFNFSFASLESALRTLDGWDELFRRIAREPKIEGTVRKDFREFLQGAMVEFVYEIEQDFATPEALARIHEMVGDIHSILDAGQITTAEALALQDLFRSFDSVLALFDFTLFSPEEIPAEILALAEDRIQAKLSKDFARSDSIR